MRADAKHFVENETQFHLGFLPTEQPNPRTRALDAVFAKSCVEGAKLLLAVDGEVVEPARKVLASDGFAKLKDAMARSLASPKGRVIFSGCGATGRLAVLLETVWRRSCRFPMESVLGAAAERGAAVARAAAARGTAAARGASVARAAAARAAKALENRVAGIITGGDFALVKSVESFEDCCEFGREQARELGVGKEDTFVAISEGGETSSVIGSVEEACERGATCFFLFNNPAEILKEKIERSRRVLENPGITAIELFSGPMAVAGSTRMQATTFEMLVAGAALEMAFEEAVASAANAAGAAGAASAAGAAGAASAASAAGAEMKNLAGRKPRAPMGRDYAALFESVLGALQKKKCLELVARQIEFEEGLYRRGGLVTYYAESVLLDVFTDTTERSPTFMVPGFKKSGDASAPPSWAFAKHLSADSEAAWELMLLRAPRCIGWSSADYRRLGAPEKILNAPPAISEAELRRFKIGGAEADPERCVLISKFKRNTRKKPKGAVAVQPPKDDGAVFVRCGLDRFDRDDNQSERGTERGGGGGSGGGLGKSPGLAGLFGANNELSAALTQFVAEKTKTPPGELRATLQHNASSVVAEEEFGLPAEALDTPLGVLRRLAMKLVFNTISTGTMVRMGRVKGNWMSFVSASNKKLVDRAIRLAADLSGASYEVAADAVFEALEEARGAAASGAAPEPPVQVALRKLQRK